MSNPSDQRRQVHALAWKIVLQSAEVASTLNELQLTELDPADSAWLRAASGALYSSYLEVEGMAEMAESGDLRPLRTCNESLRKAAA